MSKFMQTTVMSIVIATAFAGSRDSSAATVPRSGATSAPAAKQIGTTSSPSGAQVASKSSKNTSHNKSVHHKKSKAKSAAVVPK